MPEENPSILDQLVRILEQTRGIHIGIPNGQYDCAFLRRLL